MALNDSLKQHLLDFVDTAVNDISLQNPHLTNRLKEKVQ